MPLHDWARVRDWIFWDFRFGWLVRLSQALNAGLLPGGYFSMLDVRRPDPDDRPERRITVHAPHTHQVVASIEIVNPRDKESRRRVDLFVSRVIGSIEAGVHVAVVDVLPRGEHDPAGMHAAVWSKVCSTADPAAATADEPFTLAGYRVGAEVEAFVDHAVVGQQLPAMPLFLTHDAYVPIPLEETYLENYARLPVQLKAQLGDRGAA